MTTVRFSGNFILTAVQTSFNEQGEMVVSESSHHITGGETHILDSYQINGNVVTLVFAANDTIKGTAPAVELGYCRFRNSEQIAEAKAAAKSGGCGCGK